METVSLIILGYLTGKHITAERYSPILVAKFVSGKFQKQVSIGGNISDLSTIDKEEKSY